MLVEITTAEVSPHYARVREALEARKAHTLELVNYARTDNGMAPLAELPKGIPGHWRDCVLTRAFEGDVGMAQRLYRADMHVHRFVQGFDTGAYPELIDTDAPPREPAPPPMFVIKCAKPDWEAEFEKVVLEFQKMAVGIVEPEHEPELVPA